LYFKRTLHKTRIQSGEMIFPACELLTLIND
jgi:hypothetical protein